MNPSAFQPLDIERNASHLAATYHIPTDSKFFDGHFPGRPILPAVGLLTILDHLVASSLEENEFWHINRLRRVKFSALVESEGTLVVKVQPRGTDAWYEFSMEFQGRPVARGGFQCNRLSDWNEACMASQAGLLDIDMDELIPQRPPMRMVDGLVDVNKESALAASTVTHDWPTPTDSMVPGVFLVETIAQTAALHTGWLLRAETPMGGAGYLVGIPEAELNVSGVSVGTRFHTHVTALRRRKNFAVYEGSVSCGDSLLAKASIQAFKPDDL